MNIKGPTILLERNGSMRFTFSTLLMAASLDCITMSSMIQISVLLFITRITVDIFLAAGAMITQRRSDLLCVRCAYLAFAARNVGESHNDRRSWIIWKNKAIINRRKFICFYAIRYKRDTKGLLQLKLLLGFLDHQLQILQKIQEKLE